MTFVSVYLHYVLARLLSGVQNTALGGEREKDLSLAVSNSHRTGL